MEGLIRDHFAASLRSRPHRADDRRGRGPARSAGQARQSHHHPWRHSGPAHAFSRRARSRKATRIRRKKRRPRRPSRRSPRAVAEAAARRRNLSPRSPPPRRACPARPAPIAVAAASPQQLGWIKGPDPVAKGPSRDVAPSPPHRPRPRRPRQSPPRPRLRRPIMAAGSSRSASPTTPPRLTICSPAPAPRTMGNSPRRGRSPRKSPRERTSFTAPASPASTRRAPKPPVARSRRAASPASPRATEERHPCPSRTSLASLT